MDYDIFEQTITVERQLVKEVVRAVILSVLFHRTYTAVVPNTIDVLDVTFCVPKDSSIDKVVCERVDALARSLGPAGITKAQCSLVFSEKVPKKTWFGKGEEDLPWERWTFNLDIRTGSTERERNQVSSLTVTHCQTFLLRLIGFVTSKERGHIPLKAEILPEDEAANPRPWKILNGGEAGSDRGGAGVDAKDAGGWTLG